MESIEKVLIALRKIIRATDIHSKYLERTTGLTAPQILLMQSVKRHQKPTIGAVAKELNLSQATVSAIIDRLVIKSYIKREKDKTDKRRVFLALTEIGKSLVKKSPPPLQDHFSDRYSKLPEWERSMLLASLQKIALMMDAQGLDAAPVLDLGELDRH